MWIQSKIGKNWKLINSSLRSRAVLLILHLAQPTTITIGKLGTFEFPAGWYAYTGSALGPGGLAARLAYHHRREKSFQWHIDYLLAQADLVEMWWAIDNKRRECIWASALRSIPARECRPPISARPIAAA